MLDSRTLGLLVALFLLSHKRGASATSPGAKSSLAPPPANRDVALRPGGLTFNQIVTLAEGAGFNASDATYAARIAWRESGGDPKASAIVTQPKPGNLPERSFGLWQVNTLANKQYDEAQLLDPPYNARAAHELSQGGINWGPWNLP